MTKVDVANYMIQDLSRKFPLQEEGIVDEEIIDILVDSWSKKRYITPNSSLKFHHQPQGFQKYLM